MSKDSAVSATWYKEFFSGAALELWRRAIPAERTEAEVQFLHETLDAPEGGKLLDVPSGNGRLSLPMALLGYQICAVDYSQEYCDENIKRAQEYEVKIDCICDDMKAICWKNEFDGAFCMGNSFGYFDRATSIQFLRAVSTSLKSGAVFILDTAMIAEAFLVNGGEKEWYKAGDMHMLIENQYDCRESCVTTDYTFLQGGKEDHHIAKHFIYTSGELCHMLESVGMEILDMLETTDGEPFTLGADRLLLISKKRR